MPSAPPPIRPSGCAWLTTASRSKPLQLEKHLPTFPQKVVPGLHVQRPLEQTSVLKSHAFEHRPACRSVPHAQGQPCMRACCVSRGHGNGGKLSGCPECERRVHAAQRQRGSAPQLSESLSTLTHAFWKLQCCVPGGQGLPDCVPGR